MLLFSYNNKDMLILKKMALFILLIFTYHFKTAS